MNTNVIIIENDLSEIIQIKIWTNFENLISTHCFGILIWLSLNHNELLDASFRKNDY